MAESIGKQFMRQTCYDELETSAQSQGVPQPPLVLPLPPGAQLIALPAVSDLPRPALDLRSAIEQRRSLRRYAAAGLSLDELAFLLWCTQGVKRVTDRPVTFRNVPSAGARHAFETMILANRVAGLEPGLYRYAALEHALLPVDLSADVAERATHACHDQEMIGLGATSTWLK